jgi:hypothetical protein
MQRQRWGPNQMRYQAPEVYLRFVSSDRKPVLCMRRYLMFYISFARK